MNLRSVAQYVFIVFVVLIVSSLLLGQLLGQPILLGYVETGSMAPTLEPGDGFIAIPAAIAGTPESGDVVVFQAQELHDGGLTTHRVVRETADGYITKGDANPFTDQDGAEPPVTRAQIVAHALQINGEIVVIPNLGTGAETVRGAVTGFLNLIPTGGDGSGVFSGQSLIWIGVGLLVISFAIDTGGKPHETARRTRSRQSVQKPWFILAILLLAVLFPATASMVLPAGTVQFDIVSSSNPSEDPFVIQAGGSTQVEYRAFNDGYVPVVLIVEPETEGVVVDQSTMFLSPRSKKTTQLTISAPEETGAYRRQISESRYLPVLPVGVIKSLHDVHPYLAVAAVDGVLSIVTTLLVVVVLGLEPIRLRSTDRNLSIVDRLKRLF